MSPLEKKLTLCIDKMPEIAIIRGVHVDQVVDVSNAIYEAGRVRCYRDDGRVDFDLNMSVAQPTCVSFVGEDLSMLAVTTVAVGVEHERGEGDVFIYQTDRVGFSQPRFRGLRS